MTDKPKTETNRQTLPDKSGGLPCSALHDPSDIPSLVGAVNKPFPLTSLEVRTLYERVCNADKSFVPDNWQIKVLQHKGNIAIRTGRQVGKSTTVARKAADEAINHDNITILCIAAAQRQSSEIFQKIIGWLYKLHDAMIKEVGSFVPDINLSSRQNDENRRKYEFEFGIFKENPTKTEAKLKNGTRILSLPTGKTGAFVRCYSVDILIGDEAAYIAEPVWTAIKPMLAVSEKKNGLGWEILLSTPLGKGGHYFECCHDPDYLQIHISSENCTRISREFLRKEKLRMSKIEYAQEYLGEFIDEFNQFFSTALIKQKMTFLDYNYKEEYNKNFRYYLGVDIARYGEDENAFVVAELNYENKVRIIHATTNERKSIPETARNILEMENIFHFNRIFVDDCGVGGGVLDILIENLGRKVIGLNNAKKSVDKEGTKKQLLKEDLYSNALVLMESDPSKIEIVANLKLQRSLKCMTFEYTKDKNLLIYGNYSHLAEAFVRACWCVKSKG